MKNFKTYEEFVNEFGPLAGSGNKDLLEPMKRKAMKKSEKGEYVYVIGGKYGTYKLSKYEDEGNTYAAYYNGIEQDITEDFSVNEYQGKWGNLYKVMSSKTPVIGEPVFTDSGGRLKEVESKLKSNIIGYKDHMDRMVVKDMGWRENAQGARDVKGKIQWYDKAKKTREFAFKIVNDAQKFMLKYNKLYDKLKGDLTSTDHRKVAQAIDELFKIYPEELIQESGKLKRLSRMKADTPFVEDVIKWTESIKNIFDTVYQGSKVLGKSEKQIKAMKKQSSAMSMRWGRY